jgi:flagellar basal-body rod modification protein FlgD
MTTSNIGGSNSWAGILSNSTVSASAAGGTASGTAAGSAASQPDLGQTFLKLLVAQMNNQDPLNPMDNSQLTTQMAQINTVTGINTLNGTVGKLMSQLQQSATIQSAQLTGHSVMVTGSSLVLNAASATNPTPSAVGGFNLPVAASQVAVTVTDANGSVVRTLQLGAMAAGFQDFTWDGNTDAGAAAAPGNYQFKVGAADASGASVAAVPYNLQTVVGAVPQADGSTALMLGNGGQTPYASIKQII